MRDDGLRTLARNASTALSRRARKGWASSSSAPAQRRTWPASWRTQPVIGVPIADGMGGRLPVAIVGAGAAAHLAGVVAAHATQPVIGVPIDSSPLKGWDALLATVQMPPACRSRRFRSAPQGPPNAAVLAASWRSVNCTPPVASSSMRNPCSCTAGGAGGTGEGCRALLPLACAQASKRRFWQPGNRHGSRAGAAQRRRYGPCPAADVQDLVAGPCCISTFAASKPPRRPPGSARSDCKRRTGAAAGFVPDTMT